MAKKKNIPFKRIFAKNGKPYYYIKGKRITNEKGEKLFKKEIKKGTNLPSNFSQQEQEFVNRSIAAKKAAANTYRFQGRPIPKIYAVILQKQFNFNSLDEKDLSKWVNTKNKPLFKKYSDLLRNINDASKKSQQIFENLSEFGYFSKSQGKTTLIDLAETLNQKEYERFKFKIYDVDGDEIRGRKRVMDYLRKFEENVANEIKEVSNAKGIKIAFDYSITYDFVKKTFFLNLTDQDVDVSIEDILAVNLNELKLPNDKNKYLDVLITFSLS